MEAFPVKIVDGDGVMVAEAAGEFDGLAILTFLPAGEYRLGGARVRVAREFDWDGDLVLVDCGLDLRPWHRISARQAESSHLDPRIRGRLVGSRALRPEIVLDSPAKAPGRRRRRPAAALATRATTQGEAGASS